MSSPSPSEEAAVLAMAVGSVILVVCAIYVAFAVQRRRQNVRNPTKSTTGLSPLYLDSSSGLDNPTDFMNNLASWDRSHSIDDVLEKRRRAAWTMEWFGSQSNKDASQKCPEPNSPYNGVFQC